jgi:hypothetical protein
MIEYSAAMKGTYVVSRDDPAKIGYILRRYEPGETHSWDRMVKVRWWVISARFPPETFWLSNPIYVDRLTLDPLTDDIKALFALAGRDIPEIPIWNSNS